LATPSDQGVEIRATICTRGCRQAGKCCTSAKEKFNIVLNTDFFESEFNHNGQRL